MATITCPYCSTRAHMTPLQGLVSSRAGSRNRYSVTYQCDECRRLNIASTTDGRNFGSASSDAIKAEFENGAAPVEWHPKTVAGKAFPDIPASIAPAASEAFECFSIGAYRAAVMLARSVIEASAKNEGVTDGNLFTKIDKLVDKGNVRPMMAQAAHEVRMAGNGMAHGDFATAEITEEDADEILGFMEDFLREMFEIPTRVQRRKDRRASKQ